MTFTAPTDARLIPSDPEHRRLLWAAVAAGVVTFATLYSTQGILPALRDGFGTTEDTAALSVSMVTLGFAFGVIPSSMAAERIGRRRVIVASVIGAAVLSLGFFLAPLLPSIHIFLALRVLQGLVLSPLPAVIVAYLSEQIHPDYAASATGLYVAGTGFGGLIGRMIPAAVLEWAPWYVSLMAASGIVVGAAALCLGFLPAERTTEASDPDGERSSSLAALREHLASPTLIPFFVLGFTAMGAYVSYYDALVFHLQSPPYDLSEGQYSAMFLVNLAAMLASWRAGALAGRLGRAPVLIVGALLGLGGLVLGATSPLWLIVVGSVILTMGIFTAHSVASGWVSATAGHHRSTASALYMCAFYGGNGIVSAVIGHAYAAAGWDATALGVIATMGVATVAALVAVVMQRRSVTKN